MSTTSETTRPAYEPGAPPAGMIPLCVPSLGGNEWAYVKECLDTNWVSSVGSFVTRFEEALAAYVGLPHAVAAVNGTAALHIALMLAGVGEGDLVLMPALTFIAPANAVRYLGALPAFVDVEPDYWQMDVERVRSFLAGCERRSGGLFHRKSGRRVAAVMPVHILGHPVDMAPIMEIAREYGLPVIEDATESLGAAYEGRMTGSIGDIACFSFNGNKLITTGAGGMIVTANREWAERARYLTTQAKDDPLEYVHGAVGYNYRLTNVQAAIGVAQMEQIEGHIAAKHRIAGEYARRLAGVPGLALMKESPSAKSVFWLYTVLINEVDFGMDSRSLLRRLQAEKIQTRPLWQALHESPAMRGHCLAGSMPVAERLVREGLSLPCSVSLTPEEQAYVCDTIIRAATAAGSAA